MSRLFRYSTVEFLSAVGFLGIIGRSLYPTVSRAMLTFINEIPWNL